GEPAICNHLALRGWQFRKNIRIHDQDRALEAAQQPLQLVGREIEPSRSVKINVAFLRGLKGLPRPVVIYVEQTRQAHEFSVEQIEQTQNLIVKRKAYRERIEEDKQTVGKVTTKRGIKQHIRAPIAQETRNARSYIN